MIAARFRRIVAINRAERRRIVSKKRIVLVEKSSVATSAFKLIFEPVEDLEIVAAYGNVKEALESDSLKRADALIMNVGMADEDTLQYIAENYHNLAVMMIGLPDRGKNAFDQIRAGEFRYMIEPNELGQFMNSLRGEISAKSPSVRAPSEPRKALATERPTGGGVELLSDRELKILERLAKGKSYKEIAYDMYLSLGGLKYHIRNIYRKLNVKSRYEAVSKSYGAS
ncbi:MAG: hypothetical protein GF419_08685 [Ignavibacteriales bacterium]|nr:hypothetical protein [Ignavibacteriales bacterium]